MSANEKFKSIVGGVVGIPIGLVVGAVAGTVAGVVEAINSDGDSATAFKKKFVDVAENCVKGSVDIVAENAGTVAGLVVTGVVAEMDSEAKRKGDAEVRRKQRQLGKG